MKSMNPNTRWSFID